MDCDLSKYSHYWLENTSVEESKEEIDEALKLFWRFDNYIRKKKCGNNDERELPKSTKHGWYLPDDN